VAQNIYQSNWSILISQACSEDVFKFFQSQTRDSYRFISDLMGVFSMAGATSRLSRQTTWLKVKPYRKSYFLSPGPLVTNKQIRMTVCMPQRIGG